MQGLLFYYALSHSIRKLFLGSGKMRDMMRTMKELLCFILACFALLSSSACDGNRGKLSGGTGVASAASIFTQNNTVESQWNPTTDYSKKVSLTLATPQTIDGYDYTAGDGYAGFYSDKFNYDITVITIAMDNWDERLRIWINSGDMPDICVYDYKRSDAAGYVEQKLLKKLPEDWKNRWPNLAGVFDKTSLGPEMERRFHGAYFIPRARFVDNLPGDPLPDHFSFYMRRDWALAVGFPIRSTYTTSEIIQFGRLIKEKDPGRAGNELIPITESTISAVGLFVQSNSTHYRSFYKDKEGKYKWGAASEDTLKGLKLFREAYTSKVLNQQFYTDKTDQELEHFFAQAVAGGCYGAAATPFLCYVFDYFKPKTGTAANEYVNVATVLGEDGHYHQEDLINFWGATIFNPDIDNDKFERYMDMLDYNCTTEGMLQTNIGFKDVDWAYDGNDKYKLLLSPDQARFGTAGKYPSLGSHTLGVAILSDDFAFDNPNYTKESRMYSKQLYAERCKLATADSFTKTDWDLYCYDSPNMRKASIDYNMELANLVTMDGDIEANWRKWIKSKMPIVQPVLDELNTKLTR